MAKIALTASALKLELAQLEQMLREEARKHSMLIHLDPRTYMGSKGASRSFRRSETGLGTLGRKGRRSTRTFPLAWVYPKADQIEGTSNRMCRRVTVAFGLEADSTFCPKHWCFVRRLDVDRAMRSL